ncbi:hypothetical protein CAAN3_05S01134 [[Candida] anglica]
MSPNAPGLPESTVQVVRDALALYHTESAFDSLIVCDKDHRLVGATKITMEQIPLDYALHVAEISGKIIDATTNSILGGAKYAKINFGSNTLIVIINNELNICAVVKRA